MLFVGSCLDSFPFPFPLLLAFFSFLLVRTNTLALPPAHLFGGCLSFNCVRARAREQKGQSDRRSIGGGGMAVSISFEDRFLGTFPGPKIPLFCRTKDQFVVL